MEKEIKVRKKRFAAFWIVALLVGSLVVPMMVRAANYTFDADHSGTVLQPGQTIAVSGTDPYMVTYKLTNDAESNMAEAAIEAGQEHTVQGCSSESIPEGKEFTGWLVSGVYLSGGITGNVSLVAQFQDITYSITFDTDGGSAIEPIAGVAGAAITAPAAPEKTGYSFAGWDPAIPETMPVGGMVTKAQWVANTYYIRYELDGGTNGNNPPMYTYGEGVASFADAVKDGYTFEGWYSDNSFTTKVESVAITQTGDVDLYAKFEYVPAVIEAGTYELVAGVQYKLGNVTKVSGDSSVYVSGSTFYVPTSGTYTFS